MATEKLSKLQFYSLGIVSANKLISSDTIEVTPIEEFPMLDGELSDNVEQYQSKFKTPDNETVNVDIKTTISISAKWVPINNSNRRTSPDVRRGETVVLYRFADVDGYWWNTLKNDNTLRRLETVIYSFSNMSSENTPDGPDSSYWLEVSTHKKLMHVHTSKNDGEPYAYDIQIDSKNGKVVITDDVGNYFLLDSKETTLHLENAAGSFVDLNGSKINIFAPDSINMKSPLINGDASSGVNFSTPLVKTTSKLSTGSNVNVGGGVIIVGGLAAGGGMDATGSISTSGSLNSGSGITTSGSITASGSIHGSNI